MSIQLTYGDSADQQDIDTAILVELGRKTGYVVEVTYNTNHPREDVVVERFDRASGRLFVRRFDETSGKGVGEEFYILDVAIDGIKIY